MPRTWYVQCSLLSLLVFGLAACGDDDPAGPTGPFDLAFSGGASFQGAHGGQEIHVTVQETGGDVVASQSGTVSAASDPSFSFSFADVLEEGQTYELKYWIDSNFGGGTPGVCDPPANDHQWIVAVTAASDDVTMTDTHRPTETESVCAVFAFDLSFTGDASFQGAHGGQELTAAVVRAGSGASAGPLVVATEAAVVSGSTDPSFSLSFPGVLTRGHEYEIHYWIDSNFGGGTVGTCDAPANDHQWALDVGFSDEDATVADTHRPTETEEVCSTFQ